jgi:hypothetical protein
MAMKPIAPKPVGRAKRSKDPVSRGLEFFFGDKPTVKPKKKTVPVNPKGKKEMPYTGPRRERNPNLKPAGPKKKTPGIVIKPRAKKPAIIKGYNDKKYKG